MKNYIHIKNKYNNNYIKQSTTPKVINAYYNKLNSLVSPIYKRNNHLNPSKKRNLNILNNNKLNFTKDDINLSKSNNKNMPLNKYSNLLSLINNKNIKIDTDHNIKDNNHKKNISLNKLQDEIKIIQLKLKSDIIRNKIKLLSDISNDSKYMMNKIQNKSNDECNRFGENKINENNKYDMKENSNFNLDKYLIEKRIKDRKVYKIRKFKINNTDSKKALLQKRNIDCDAKNNYNYENKTFYHIKKNGNYSNNIYFINKNLRINSELNEPKIFKNEIKSDIKSRIDMLLEKKKKMKTMNIINFDSDDNNKRYFPRTPNNQAKSAVNSEINYNINSNSKKSFINGKKNFLKNYDRSYNENFLKIKKNDKNRKNGKCISKDIPQGFFDNFFINNYSINNINNTTIYNNKANKPINDIENIKYKNTFEKNDKLIQDKKDFENQKEKKVIDFSFINNGNNKKNLIENSNKNNRIINTVNFSFNPFKISYEQSIFIPKTHEIKNNESNNNYQNINIINNKKNIIREKIIHNENENKNIEKKDENKSHNIKSIIEHNKYLKKEINNNINSAETNINNIKDINVKNKEENKFSSINPDELGQETIILNSSREKDRLEKVDNNINDSLKNIKKMITFNEIKIIIKYYQNDYIKKSFIFSDNDFKKIKHNYLSTKEHIQNLKKHKKLKSILLVKEDKNKIKNDKLNLALFKLNELISEVKTNEANKTDENNKIKEDNKTDYKSENNIKVPFIKKNINYIKTIQEYYKKGISYRCLSKSEIKLLKKKKKIMCHRFQDNPQNFFSEKLCDNLLKSFDFNLDDSDATKMNKKGFIKKKLGYAKIESELENKLNNSFIEENRGNNLSFI